MVHTGLNAGGWDRSRGQWDGTGPHRLLFGVGAISSITTPGQLMARSTKASNGVSSAWGQAPLSLQSHPLKGTTSITWPCAPSSPFTTSPPNSSSMISTGTFLKLSEYQERPGGHKGAQPSTGPYEEPVSGLMKPSLWVPLVTLPMAGGLKLDDL